MSDVTLSFVCACYDVARYVRETVGCLLAQELPAGTFEIVLVDDGSTDDTWRILEEIGRDSPETVRILRKENGGVSSARNAGLALSRGRLVSFIDPDDLVGPTYGALAIEALERFGQADIVAGRLEYFEKRSGPHRLSRSFGEDIELVDLNAEPQKIQLSGASVVIRRAALSDRPFDERLHNGEDSKLLTEMLISNPVYVRQPKMVYRYRVRLDASNQLARSARSAVPHTAKIDHSFMPIVERYEAMGLPIPKFMQVVFAYQISFMLNLPQAHPLFAVPDWPAYKERLLRIAATVDRSIWGQLDAGSHDHRLAFQRHFLLRQGHIAERGMAERNTTRWMSIDGIDWRVPKAEILFVDNCGTDAFITGRVFLLAGASLRIEIDGQPVGWEDDPSLEEPMVIFGEEVGRYTAFVLRIRRDRIARDKPLEIWPSWVMEGERISFDLRARRFANGLSRIRMSTYRVGPMLFSYQRERMRVDRYAGRKALFYELRILKRIWAARQFTAAALRIADMVVPRRGRPLAIVMDRANAAGDSAEVLVDYWNSPEGRDIKAFDHVYCLDRSSPDWPRMSRKTRTIAYGSLRHRYLILRARMFVGTHADELLIHPRPQERSFVEDRRWRTLVYLGHGVKFAKDVSGWQGRTSKNFSRIVASTHHEVEELGGRKFGYGGRIIATPMIRYDKLAEMAAGVSARDTVLLVPTWRKGFEKRLRTCTPAERLGLFAASSYCRTWQAAHRALQDDPVLKERGIGCRLIWHPAIREMLREAGATGIEGLDPVSYPDEIVRAACLVTDFSSLFFDALFVRRPVAFFAWNEEPEEDERWRPNVGLGDEGSRFGPDMTRFGPGLSDLDELVRWCRKVTSPEASGEMPGLNDPFLRREASSARIVTSELNNLCI